MKSGRVIQSYDSEYHNAMFFKKGEYVHGEVKESPWKGWMWCSNNERIYRWVPKSYIKLMDDKVNLFIFLKDYNAKELSVTKGEKLMLFYEESDWVWVRNQKGEEGWVPLENVKVEGEKNG